MLINAPTLEAIDKIHEDLKLPELFVYGYWEDGHLVSLIEGWVHADKKLIQVEHMIVLPQAPNRARALLQVSKQGIECAHAQGLDIVLQILKDDPRAGLHAWAERFDFTPYFTEDTGAVWYILPCKEPQHG